MDDADKAERFRARRAPFLDDRVCETGTGLLVPKRRNGSEPLSPHIREFNKAISSRRACVERVIAHLKNWKILATGYRRLLANFPATLAAVTALETFRTSTSAS